MDKEMYGWKTMAELAEWYWESLDLQVLNELGIRRNDHEKVVRQNFLFGDCVHFASVLHDITGWQSVILSSPKKGFAHAMVCAPDGRLLDAGGWTSEANVAKRYGLRQPLFQNVTREALNELDGGSEEFEDDEHADPTDGVFRVALVISSIRALSGAPFDEPWFREMSCREMQGVDTPLRRETVIPKP